MRNKKGQLTIFIIIAVLIVAGIALFFALGGFRIISSKVPSSIEPVYNDFLECLKENTLTGISILESQGGYIKLPDFIPGSTYMPFSSQLVFVGNPIPYWYYVSGNNIESEQVPSKKEMEIELAEFIDSKIRTCDFDNYYEEGFEIDLGEPTANVDITGKSVNIDLIMDIDIVKGTDHVSLKSHKINVNSYLGQLYDSAKEIFEQEQNELFLEEYAVDTLRLYAPVDGVEITCSPKIWEANELVEGLKDAIETNSLATNTNAKEDYFDLDISVGNDVRLINSKSWPSSFEISPTEDNILIAEPIGNQQGLGALGFCYVPYHFVYDVKYPILIQVFNKDEVFQFPMAVIVNNNLPRDSASINALTVQSPELCQYKNTPTMVNVYDNNLNLVDAIISYECFGERCNIGTTENGFIREDFPQCVNGYVVARTDGYEETSIQYSTTSEGSVDIILNKLYDLNVDLKLDNIDYNGNAVIYFNSDKNSKSIIYPEQDSVQLSEGEYEIQVYIYRSSSLELGATTHEQCIEVTGTGIKGLFGITEEKCFDIEIPAQVVSDALAGGGSASYYIIESKLASFGTIEINTPILPLPETVEQLQDNYLLLEDKHLGITFR